MIVAICKLICSIMLLMFMIFIALVLGTKVADTIWKTGISSIWGYNEG